MFFDGCFVVSQAGLEPNGHLWLRGSIVSDIHSNYRVHKVGSLNEHDREVVEVVEGTYEMEYERI